jgi:hypothetical protein
MSKQLKEFAKPLPDSVLPDLRSYTQIVIDELLTLEPCTFAPVNKMPVGLQRPRCGKVVGTYRITPKRGHQHRGPTFVHSDNHLAGRTTHQHV